jgi:ORF6N domain
MKYSWRFGTLDNRNLRCQIVTSRRRTERTSHRDVTTKKAAMGGQSLIPPERIERSILAIRGQRVILDADLAALYGVATKTLNRAVQRNRDRFPNDFMFQLTGEEFANLRFHFGTSSSWGGRRYPPYAFTEQGVAMLSSVLRSKQAVQVNVEIMRAFVRLRQIVASHAELARKLDALERKYDRQFKAVFDAIRELMLPVEQPKTGRIGFRSKS